MKSSSDQELIGKLIILGDSSVGKTSMFMKYFDNKFDERTNPTLGVDYKIRTVPLGGGQQMKMMIWDTSGQERYHSISDSFYRNSDGIFIVFSLLDRESFEHISKWLDRVYNQAPKDVIIMLIGNKCDLNSARKVDYETVSAKAKSLGLTYIETSAKDGTNLNEAILEMATRMAKRGKADSHATQGGRGLLTPAPGNASNSFCSC